MTEPPREDATLGLIFVVMMLAIAVVLWSAVVRFGVPVTTIYQGADHQTPTVIRPR